MKDYKKLNIYLSNLAVLNVNLHNLHWNVVGERFKEVHEYIEELYDDVFEKYDEVAELLKMKGEKPLVKLSDYLKNASIEELDGDEFTTIEALNIVKGYIEETKKMATDIRNEADQDGDFEVVSKFEDYLADHSKDLWFVSSMLK